jgi:hypothetical protein
MALITVKKIKYVSKKIQLEEEILHQLNQYVQFLDLDKEKEEDNEGLVINKALEYLFSKDKDFKKYIENKSKESKNSKDTNSTEPSSTSS